MALQKEIVTTKRKITTSATTNVLVLELRGNLIGLRNTARAQRSTGEGLLAIQKKYVRVCYLLRRVV